MLKVDELKNRVVLDLNKIAFPCPRLLEIQKPYTAALAVSTN